MAPTTKEALHRKRQEELNRKKEEEAAEEQLRKQEATERRRQEAERKRIEAEQKRQKDAEQRRIKEAELKQQEELKQKERERQQDKLKRLTSSQVDPPAAAVDTTISTLTISGNSSQPLNNNTAQTNTRNINTRPANNTKKRNQPRQAPVAIEKPSPSNEEKGSFKDPQKAFDESMKLIGNERWDVKCSGIENIRRLATHHPEVISQTQQLHTLNLALISEVKNLRSAVSRLAIVALGEIYSNLGRAAETDLDQTAKSLISKYAESNTFIHEELDRTFRSMIEHLTAQRCMCALINGGAGHKGGPVRRATSQFLVPIVERMGPGRVLSGVKEVTEKILPMAVSFLLDGSPDTRYNGQCILSMLIQHDDFDRMMTKHVAANTLRNVQDKLENLKKKGLGEPPSEPGSAKTQRSGRERSNNSFRGNSASSTASGSNSSGLTPAHPPPITKRPSATRTDEATTESIAVFCQKMKANNWQERQTGINDMVAMTESRPTAVCNNITKIFDAFIPCLKDSNSKTNLHALQMMIRLTPALSEHLGSVVNMLVQNLSANLSSKNKDIYETASQALDELMEHIDAQQLIQPMVQQAQSGSARIKPDMVERVAFLTMTLGQHGGRIKTIRMHSLPLIWHLLNTVPTSGTVPGQSGSLRVAVTHLTSSLHSTLGDELFKASKDQSKVTPRMVQFLQEMVDNPE